MDGVGLCFYGSGGRRWCCDGVCYGVLLNL